MTEKSGQMNRTVDRIGKYRLPHPVDLAFSTESGGVVYASCDELNIVNCSDNFDSAEAGLEAELADAIELYLHILAGKPLEPQAEKFRELLALVKEEPA